MHCFPGDNRVPDCFKNLVTFGKRYRDKSDEGNWLRSLFSDLNRHFAYKLAQQLPLKKFLSAEGRIALGK